MRIPKIRAIDIRFSWVLRLRVKERCKRYYNIIFGEVKADGLNWFRQLYDYMTANERIAKCSEQFALKFLIYTLPDIMRSLKNHFPIEVFEKMKM